MANRMKKILLFAAVLSIGSPGCSLWSRGFSREIPPSDLYWDSLEIWEDEQFAVYCEETPDPDCYTHSNCPVLD